MLIKLLLILIITIAMFFSLWKVYVSLIVPAACLWGYGWATGFNHLSVRTLVILTAVHLLFHVLAWGLSNKYREANLAYTGAGITGFSTGILATLFLGGLLGSFMWWSVIGRLITHPVGIRVRAIALSFTGGIVKLVYSTVASGVVAYILF